MPLPIDLAGDWRLMNADLLRDVGYRRYSPGADDGAADPHAAAVDCVGVKGPERVAEEGGRAVTRAPWTITGLTGRPVLRSLIVDGADSWVVETAKPDPASGTVFECDCYLG